ncbi:octanoyltransferase, mitochondrial [Diutina catenulata]
MNRCFRRFNSCTTKFAPLDPSYGVLRHIHFPGTTPFATGQRIQEMVVGANLDFKQMETKIRRQMKSVPEGYKLNDYEDELLKKVLAMKPLPTLLTFEFDNVYTGGKKMKTDPELEKKVASYRELGCEYHQLERGGQVTWHGQGQLTAYVILDIKGFSNLSVRCFVDSVLLRAAQNVMKKHYNIDTYLDPANPGVWTQREPYDGKIVSVGCHIQRAITSYGIGMNVANDLKYLNSFEMCGMPEVTATSVATMIPGAQVSVEQAATQYAQQLAKVLNIGQVDHVDGREVLEQAGEAGKAE